MLSDWIEVKKTKKFKSFTLINVDEKKIPNKKILDYLGEEMLNSYRRVDYLKRTYSKKTPRSLKKYLTNVVFPPVIDPFNVQQGDFGETIARLFIEKFQSLKVPCYKLRYKFNNSKAVFCTDIFAHNTGAKITDLKYYEVKTKINNSKSEVSIKGTKQQRHIAV